MPSTDTTGDHRALDSRQRRMVDYVRQARRGREILRFDSRATAQAAAQLLRQQAPQCLSVSASYHTVIIRLRRPGAHDAAPAASYLP